jgi:hypothetical protein
LTYPSAIGAALRAELGDTHQAAKTLARWTGASERTAKNWLAGRIGPSGKHLVAIIGRSDGALNGLLRLAGRKKVIPAMKLTAARDYLAKAVRDFDALSE